MRHNRMTQIIAARVATLLLSVIMVVPSGSWAETQGFISAIVIEPEKTASLGDVMESLRREPVVYVGETHDAYGDHLLQLEVLRGLAEGPGPLALGVEWFQWPFQKVLDDYIGGRIDEAQMLRDTEYFNRWRFDYRLYRPIMQFAREHGIPVLALNAPVELTREISRLGIEGLPESLTDQLPDGYDFSDAAYTEMLRDVFRAHAAGRGDFQRFMEVQLTWDETMAQGVASYLEENPATRMLIFAGRGHIAGRSGIPNRVTRRSGLRGAVVLSLSGQGQGLDAADYLVLGTERQLPPAGLMHAMLDEQTEGVVIAGFSGEHSPAKVAGVQTGDRILAINGIPIRHFADVKLALIDDAPGAEIELRLERTGIFGRKREESLRFALAGERQATMRH